MHQRGLIRPRRTIRVGRRVSGDKRERRRVSRDLHTGMDLVVLVENAAPLVEVQVIEQIEGVCVVQDERRVVCDETKREASEGLDIVKVGHQTTLQVVDSLGEGLHGWHSPEVCVDDGTFQARPRGGGDTVTNERERHCFQHQNLGVCELSAYGRRHLHVFGG